VDTNTRENGPVPSDLNPEDPSAPTEGSSRWLDLLLIALVALAAAAVRWTIPGVVDAQEEALSPLFDAMRLLGSPVPESPKVPGFGRALSHVPFVVGQPDGLVAVFVRRAAAQSLLPVVVFLVARSRCRSWMGPLAAALLFAVADGPLRSLLAGGASLAPEWIGVALLCTLRPGSRLAAMCAGLALAIATMNTPLALAGWPLLLLFERRVWTGVGCIVGLVPMALDLVDTSQAGVPLTEALGMNPLHAGTPMGEVAGQLFARLEQPSNVLLFAAPIVALYVVRRDAAAPALALGSSLALAFAAGWLQEGWWWPLMPWFAVALAVTVDRLGRPAVAVVLVVALHAGLTFDPGRSPETLRFAGHIHALAEDLDDRRAEGPFSLLGVAEAGGDGQASLVGVVLDRALAGRADGLFAEGARPLRSQPLLVHVEGEPEFVSSARTSMPAGMTLVLVGTRALAVRAPDLEAATPWLEGLCADRALDVDGPARWQALLDRGATAPLFRCATDPG
jgi:hypothetical protein